MPTLLFVFALWWRAPPNLLARALLFRPCLAAGDRLDAWFARISPKIVSVRGTGKKAFNSAPLRRGFLLAPNQERAGPRKGGEEPERR